MSLESEHWSPKWDSKFVATLSEREGDAMADFDTFAAQMARLVDRVRVSLLVSWTLIVGGAAKMTTPRPSAVAREAPEWQRFVFCVPGLVQGRAGGDSGPRLLLRA